MHFFLGALRVKVLSSVQGGCALWLNDHVNKQIVQKWDLCLGLLRVSEYSDIRGSEFKIEYGYSSLPKSLDRDLFFFFFFYLFLTETRNFSQNGPLKFSTMTTVLINNISYSNTFVSCRLVTPLIGN